jgi:hypothetical protein
VYWHARTSVFCSRKPTAGHDLDDACAALGAFAYRGAKLARALGLAAHVPAMATPGRDRRPGCHDRRASKAGRARGDPLTPGKDSPLAVTQVSHGGHTRCQLRGQGCPDNPVELFVAARSCLQPG